MPSEKVLQAKQEKVNALTEQLKNAAACVLVDYKGITVEEDTKLRKELREAGVSYSVQKNTLIRLAMHNIGFEQFDGILEGTTAIATSEGDQTVAARILGDFAEKSNGKFRLASLTVSSMMLTASRHSPRSRPRTFCSHSSSVPFRVRCRSSLRLCRLSWTRRTKRLPDYKAA